MKEKVAYTTMCFHFLHSEAEQSTTFSFVLCIICWPKTIKNGNQIEKEKKLVYQWQRRSWWIDQKDKLPLV